MIQNRNGPLPGEKAITCDKLIPIKQDIKKLDERVSNLEECCDKLDEELVTEKIIVDDIQVNGNAYLGNIESSGVHCACGFVGNSATITDITTDNITVNCCAQIKDAHIEKAVIDNLTFEDETVDDMTINCHLQVDGFSCFANTINGNITNADTATNIATNPIIHSCDGLTYDEWGTKFCVQIGDKCSNEINVNQAASAYSSEISNNADNADKFDNCSADDWRDYIASQIPTCAADSAKFAGKDCDEWKTIIKETCVDNAVFADTATNLASNPQLSLGSIDCCAITVTAGNMTSQEFTVPYASEASTAGLANNSTCFDGKTYAEACADILSGCAAKADEATCLKDAPVLSCNGSCIYVTAGNKNSNCITVPYSKCSAATLISASGADSTFPIVMDSTAGNASGYHSFIKDCGNNLTYNPSKDILHAPNITATNCLKGSIIGATNCITTPNIEATCVITCGVCNNGNSNINGDVNIGGDLYVTGTAHYTHSEEVITESENIILRDGATTPVASGHYSGFVVTNYDGNGNDLEVGADSAGTLKIGTCSSNMEAVATRDDSDNMEDSYATKWCASCKKIVTSGIACTHDLCVNGDACATGSVTANAFCGSLVGNADTATDATCFGGHTYAGACSDILSGNAASASKLSTSCCINGTAFDGSSNITTSKWGTARNVQISDCDGTNVSGTVSVDGSANVCLKLPSTIKATLTGKADTAKAVTTCPTTVNATCYVTLSANNTAGDKQIYTNTNLKYNPSTGALTATTFCGSFTGTSDNATCFDGKTYSCACADIRCGLTSCVGTVTVLDKADTTYPIAICTGATSVGKSSGCSFTYNASNGEINNLGSKLSAYCAYVPSPNNTKRYLLVDFGKKDSTGLMQVYNAAYKFGKSDSNSCITGDNSYGDICYSHIGTDAAPSTCMWLAFIGYRPMSIFADTPVSIKCNTTTAPTGITFTKSTLLTSCTGTVTGVTVNGVAGTGTGAVTVSNVPACGGCADTANCSKTVCIVAENTDSAYSIPLVNGWNCATIANVTLKGSSNRQLTFNPSQGVLDSHFVHVVYNVKTPAIYSQQTNNTSTNILFGVHNCDNTNLCSCICGSNGIYYNSYGITAPIVPNDAYITKSFTASQVKYFKVADITSYAVGSNIAEFGIKVGVNSGLVQNSVVKIVYADASAGKPVVEIDSDSYIKNGLGVISVIITKPIAWNNASAVWVAVKNYTSAQNVRLGLSPIVKGTGVTYYDFTSETTTAPTGYTFSVSKSGKVIGNDTTIDGNLTVQAVYSPQTNCTLTGTEFYGHRADNTNKLVACANGNGLYRALYAVCVNNDYKIPFATISGETAAGTTALSLDRVTTADTFTYNPMCNTLRVGTVCAACFCGALCGTVACATNATNATNANFATNAGNAANASNAGFATSAGSLYDYAYTGDCNRNVIITDGQSGCYAHHGYSTVCPLTFNPATGVLTAKCFCGCVTATGTIDNATCFAGCTYASAKTDIRSGLTSCTGTVTITNSNANSSIPVALCTGSTSVGKSTGNVLCYNPFTGALCARQFNSTTAGIAIGNICGDANASGNCSIAIGCGVASVVDKSIAIGNDVKTFSCGSAVVCSVVGCTATIFIPQGTKRCDAYKLLFTDTNGSFLFNGMYWSAIGQSTYQDSVGQYSSITRLSYSRDANAFYANGFPIWNGSTNVEITVDTFQATDTTTTLNSMIFTYTRMTT